MKKLGKGRRGVSLAYVIVAAMALLILCGALTAAAARNLDLTVDSLDGRQAYLTAKSAVEYAKGEALRELQNGGPEDFSVGPASGGAPFRIVKPAADPDGVDVLARCVQEGDGVRISARVKCANSDRYRTFGYTFSLSLEQSFDLPGDFMAVGSPYGTTRFLNDANHFSSSGTSDYPVLLKQTMLISGNQNNLTAPSVFFIGARGPSGQAFQCSDASVAVGLKADFVYLEGTVPGKQNPPQHSVFTLNNNHRVQGSGVGVVWFSNVTITVNGAVSGQYDGLYQFRNGTDLFNSASRNAGLTQISPDECEDYESYSGMVSYLEKNGTHVFSSEENGVKWTTDGKMQTSPSNQTGNDVFLFTTDQGNLQNSGNTIYRARSIMMLNGGSPFRINNFNQGTSVELRADTVWLCGKGNGSTGMDGAFEMEQNHSASKFILRASDGSGAGKVTVLLPNGLRVKKVGGSQYSVDAGNYSVNSGIDLYTADPEKNFTEIDSGGGGSGGSGGGVGGYTISGGTYTNS